jgi:hypothetical protein
MKNFSHSSSAVAHLLWALLCGVLLLSMPLCPTGVLGFVFEFPDKQVVVTPKGEHARRFDFLYERFRKRSLHAMRIN